VSEAEANAGLGRRVLALIVALVAWAVPGAGHLLLRRWLTALALFGCVAALALTGILLRGRIFQLDSGGFFELLGFVADCGAGIFFFLPRWMEIGAADVSRAAGDYGTRFFATAGVLNVLCALDAYRLALTKD
jgi:hypothetical protein